MFMRRCCDKPSPAMTMPCQCTRSRARSSVVQVFRLPPERVFVSVYKDDEDAYALWRDAVGVPETHIHRLGAEDNFWESGPTGASPLGARRLWCCMSPFRPPEDKVGNVLFASRL